MENDTENPLLGITCKGYRNVLCPYYKSCLDYTSKHYWEFWTMFELPA